jgi:cytochrome c oxidase assembly factor CtaG
MPGMNMPGMSWIPFTLKEALTRWSVGPFTVGVDVVVLFLGVWYLRADRILASRGRPRRPGRTAAFVGGLVSVVIAVQSSVAVYSGEYFEAHVVQHVLLMVFAPALLALGAPSTLLLQTASRRTKQRFLHVLRSVPFAVASNPVLVWFLYFGVMLVFFLTPLLNFAMQHMAFMDFMNVLFLLGGALFWWPMVGLDPIIHWKMGYPARMANLLLGSALEAFLGIAILLERHPEASMYTLASSHAGGALLWVSVDVVNLVAFVPIFLQWARSEERNAARLDARSVREEIAAAAAPASEDGPLAPAHPRALTLWEEQWLARRGVVPSSGQTVGARAAAPPPVAGSA